MIEILAFHQIYLSCPRVKQVVRPRERGAAVEDNHSFFKMLPKYSEEHSSKFIYTRGGKLGLETLQQDVLSQE